MEKERKKREDLENSKWRCAEAKVRKKPTVDYCEVCIICNGGEGGDDDWWICEYCERAYHKECVSMPEGKDDACYICTICPKCGENREEGDKEALLIQSRTAVHHIRFAHSSCPKKRKNR